jgi:serpin B
MPPIVTPAERSVVEADEALAADLYQVLRNSTGNLAFSPYSLASTLRMSARGARGRTAEEMAQVLHLDDADEAAAGAGEIAARLDRLRHESIELDVADTVWLQSGLRLQPAFVAALQAGHGTTLRRADFRRDPEQSRQQINQAIAQTTHGRIKDLLHPGTIDTLSRLVLTNAIYLRAAWAFPFPTDATTQQPFHRADGSIATVPMMRRTARYGYASRNGFQAVRLPYAGGGLACTLFVPTGPLEAHEQRLAHEGLQLFRAGVRGTNVDLAVPRFRVRTKRVVNRDLRALGMTDAFDEHRADFTGITRDEPLVISHVVHEAYVEVDEQGTEAAAATGVVMRSIVRHAPPIRVVVDRPFLFAITDTATFLPLFLGRVQEPSTV